MSFFSLLLSVVTNPHLLRSLAGLLILAGTWYLCTVLRLPNSTRLVIMVGVLLLVVLAQVLLTRRSRRKREKAAKALETSMIMEADHTVAAAGTAQKRAREEARRELVAAIDVLKHSQLADGRGGRAALYVLPWYLVLGADSSGKSGLIRNSGLQPPDKGPGELRGIGASTNCEWWFTNHAVVLEADRRFASATGARAADPDWEAFLAMLRKQRPRVPLNGVLLAIPADDLLLNSPGEIEAQARLLRRRLDMIGDELKLVFPVYLTVTKLDLVQGFEDYFSGLGGAGGEQVFGCTLRAANLRGSGVEQLLAAEFELLYENLCRRRQMRLVLDEHQPRREGTYLFPLQMRSLGESLQRFARVLCESNAYGRNPLLRGIYFTSVGGDGTLADPVRQEMSRKLGLPAPSAEAARPGRPLFLRAFFRKILVLDRDIARPTRGAAKRMRLVRRLIQVAVLAALVVAGVFLAMRFAKNLDLVRDTAGLARSAAKISVDANLRGYGVDGKLQEELDGLLGKLKELDDAGSASRRWMNLGLYRGKRVEEKARGIYLDGLVDMVFVPFRTDLRIWLLNDLRNDPDEEFYRRYLVFRMLGTPVHGVDSVMVDVLGKMSARPGAEASPGVKERLEKHLAFALRDTASLQPRVSERIRTERQDSGIIAAANTYIESHWEFRNYYQEVIANVNGRRGDLEYSLQDLTSGGGVLPLCANDAAARPLNIPAAFTRRGWEEVKLSLGDSKVLQRESWVWPESFRPDLAGYHDRFVQEYAREYVRHWGNFLADVTIVNPGTLAEADNRLGDLLKAESPYRKLLDDAAENLKFDLKARDDGEEAALAMNGITTAFGSLHVLLRKEKDGKRPLDAFLDSVAEVQALVAKDKTGEPRAAAAAYTRGIFAKDGPDQDSAIAKSLAAAERHSGSSERSFDSDCSRALELYLKQPAMAAWQAYLRETEQYLEGRWAATVRKEFSTLAGRYPLDRQAKDDASVDAFAAFFHDGGTLQSFVDDYLSPYVVDPDHAPKLKHGGLGLQLTPDATGSLNAGLRLKRVLFANGGARPGFTFQVKPGGQPGVPEGHLYVKFSVFKVGKQELRYSQGPMSFVEFSWPPAEDSMAAAIKVTMTDTSILGGVEVEPSPWALFRLIDSAVQRPTESLNFKLTWKVEVGPGAGSVVEIPYEFRMGGPDHALLRNLTEFSCPERLFE